MRIEKTLVLEDGGRKFTFHIRLMSALRMEGWLARAAEVLPPEIARPVLSDPTALAALILRRGFLALACAEHAEPLLEDLLRCCSLADTETGVEIPCSSEVLDSRLHDVTTLLRLREAALLTNLAFAQEGARKPFALPREAAFLRSFMEHARAQTTNVPQVTASLVAQGMASLNDLRTIYTYRDALDLLEILNVRNYNQWAALEAAKTRRR